MEEYFKCSNCKELIEDVYESECCGRLYCDKCVGNIVNEVCPFCHLKTLRFSKNVFAERIQKEIKIHCKYCNAYLPYRELIKHMMVCEEKMFECSFGHCCYKGKKKEIVAHMIKSHELFMLVLMEEYPSFSKEIKKLSKEDNVNKDKEKDDETIIDFNNSFSGNFMLNQTFERAIPSGSLYNANNRYDRYHRPVQFIPIDLENDQSDGVSQSYDGDVYDMGESNYS